MNITNLLSIEDLGTDYKNQERARLRIKIFVDGEPCGDPQGMVYVSGLKRHIESLANGHLSLDDFKKLNQ